MRNPAVIGLLKVIQLRSTAGPSTRDYRSPRSGVEGCASYESLWTVHDLATCNDGPECIEDVASESCAPGDARMRVKAYVQAYHSLTRKRV